MTTRARHKCKGLAVLFLGLASAALAQRPPVFGTGIGIVELRATVKNERGELVTAECGLIEICPNPECEHVNSRWRFPSARDIP